MKHFLLLYVTLILASFSSLQAGEKKLVYNFSETGTIKGKVIDENEKPIEFVNISIHKRSDSSVVNGGFSKKDGQFEITGVPIGDYFVKISCIGFRTKYIGDISLASQNTKDLGNLKIISAAVQMNEKTITAERVSEEFRTDKKVINVSQNLTAAGGTALDVLQNQPSIQTDANGNVTMRGSSNYTVQVNGRPSVLQGVDALRQIPASQIENIELITNPSSKYDAEGSAGIINIILKKQIDNSIAGIWNAGAGSRDKYNSDFTLNVKTDNISYYAGFDYRNTGMFNNQSIERTIPLASVTQRNNSSIDMNMTRKNTSGKAGFEYTFADKSVFGLNSTGGKFSFIGNVNSKIDITETNSNPIYNKNTDKRQMDANFFNISSYYSKAFTPKVNEMNIDLYFARVNMPSDQITSEYITDGYYSPLTADVISNQLINNSDRTEGRFKLNYKYIYSPKSTLETGIQTNLFYKTINLESNRLDVTGNWIPTKDYGNSYDFRNNIYSGFISYSNEILGFDYQIGLRGEFTDRLLDQLTMNHRYEYQKFHLFPTIYFTYKIAADQQLQVNYTRRINRPPDQLLNPYPMFSSTYFVSQGNPGLQPEFTNSFEFNYQKYFTGGLFSIQTYFRQTLDGMNQRMSVEGEKTITSFINITENRALGSEISGSVTLAPWIKVDPALNIFDNKIIGSSNVSEEHYFSWNFRLNTNLTVFPSTRVMLTTFYFARNVMPLGEIGPMFNWTVALRQELFERKLILNLSAQNLLYIPKIKINTSGTNFFSNIAVKQEAPVIMLTASYNFNNFKANPKTQNNVDINPGNAF